MKACVVQFAGSNCDMDSFNFLSDTLGIETDLIWHKQRLQKKYDLILLPGGFSYGDYLRPGAIAKFSNIMNDVLTHIKEGRLTIGICNGFQILCECDALPGVLLRNKYMKFICKDVYVKVINQKISRNIKSKVLSLPVAHMDGNYYAEEETVKKLVDEDRVLLKYSDSKGKTERIYNPNGSSENIAGIVNEGGNVFGMMPHPERNPDNILGNGDGSEIVKTILNNK
ncbi:MAG: phosphoribosylformylglycinamidine synthase subunit PurQ [Candidatus Muiribacteriota bacterium]